jgi:hypothetical protein
MITIKRKNVLNWFLVLCTIWFIPNTVYAQARVQTVVLKASKHMVRKMGFPIFDSTKMKQSLAVKNDTIQIVISITTFDTVQARHGPVLLYNYIVNHDKLNKTITIPVCDLSSIKCLIYIFDSDKIYYFRKEKKANNVFKLTKIHDLNESEY